MHLAKQKIGMWGLGIVGWSVLKYLAAQKINSPANLKLDNIKLNDFTLTVFEQRDLNPEEFAQLASLGVALEINLEKFLNSADLIIPSPGIDLRSYQAYKSKFYSELDLFSANFHKPILAITGSLGKTTVTTVLAELLTKLNLRVGVGGNIGVGMCDLITQQTELDLVVLELSSFQLEQAQKFRANGALWTNFCANHLDRHDNLSEYFKAKLRLFELQETTGISLLPGELLKDRLALEQLAQANIKSKLSWFGLTRPKGFGERAVRNSKSDVGVGEGLFIELIDSRKIKNLYYVQDNFIVREQAGELNNLIAVGELDASILLINWVALVGFLDLVSSDLLALEILPIATISKKPVSNTTAAQDQAWESTNNLINILQKYKFAGIEHRLEFFTELNGVKFYNDSKSTVPEATLAALEKLTNSSAGSVSPIILILGGLGKGVQRDKFIGELVKYKNLKQIIIFGGESENLKKWCDLYNLNSVICVDLPAVITQIWQIAKLGDTVLFSPSGSSYDLFKNYMVRGQEFKKIVLKQSRM
ncbi:MAG TPA: UDP-N-acetylmuramoyl-L-alanine--D-glutamate ligase [Candidatus Babeliales bacterium]|nr:UDP-N-acetylmuramoyl-L-alanine--D-glutamate ligase [Candidatus Babeliales bacterium]